MDGTVIVGDVIVCRVNGTADVYVVGTVVSGTVGELSLQRTSTMVGRDLALRRGYDEQAHERHVWSSTAPRPASSRRRRSQTEKANIRAYYRGVEGSVLGTC
jgi:hypothetical protein